MMKLNSTENQYQRNGVIAVTKPDNVIPKLLERVYGKNLVMFGDVG
jgi:hypothetical protein